jgi:signal transduction histidine kinase
MKASWCDLETHYTFALQDYVRSPDEAALHRAYELGRKALDDGLGVLEIAVLYHKALARLLANLRTSEEIVPVAKAAESFFVESLAPFEMTHRGIRDANNAWRQLNGRLEEEAKRIAYTLHEETSQFVACAHLALHELARDVSPSHPSLQELKNLLDQIAAQLRQLSHELRPAVLDEFGLVPALEFLADGISKRTGVQIHVEGLKDDRLPVSIETALYRMVHEALTNVSRHARATAVNVRLCREPRMIRCSITDDGVGFDTSAVMARKTHGIGLLGIEHRLKVLGGTLQIKSEPGRGTEIFITIPLEI